MDNLEPCPRPDCGGEASISDNGHGLVFTAECTKCHMRGPWERCATDARDSWNTLPRQKPVEAGAIEWKQPEPDFRIAAEFVKELAISGMINEEGHMELAVCASPQAVAIITATRRAGELRVARWLQETAHGDMKMKELAARIEKGLPDEG